MYDYVAILTFEENTLLRISLLREILENNGYKCALKLPPHITIDLYEDIDESEIVNLIDKFIEEIHSFTFQFESIADFDNKVLFIKPNNIEMFEKIKNLFDLYLGNYKIKNNANNGIYKPHVTLLNNGDIVNAKAILNQQFNLFDGKITQLCIYAKNKQLIKKYDLSSKTFDEK